MVKDAQLSSKNRLLLILITMKITNIESFRLKIPLLDRPRPEPWTEMLLVRVDTDSGLSGWGEAWSLSLTDATKAALDITVSPLCIGKSTHSISELMLTVRKSIGNTRNGPLTFAVSAIDIASWDLLGKEAELPIHRLIGGTSKTTLPAYASLFRYADPEIAIQKASEAVSRGYRHLKLHEKDILVVKAVCDALGKDISVRLDPAWAWTPNEALIQAHKLEELNLVWLEEPIWPPEDYRSLSDLAKNTSIPLAAGENCISAMDFRHLWEAGAAKFLQPSVTKIGGITEALKVAALADITNAEYAPHSYYHGPGFIASLHLAAAWPGNIVVEHGYDDLERHPYGDKALVCGGEISVPMHPGLGFDPEEDFLMEYSFN
jgi:L-alanine-DL-glutamate epimerase-like enolase superfamily enzyme